MSYAGFLGAVLSPALAIVVGAALHRAYRSPSARPLLTRGLVTLAVLSAVAVGYTLPWDSRLIAHGVWWYDPGSVLARYRRVPVEEIAFMVGQTLLVGGWALTVLTGVEPADRPAGRRVRGRRAVGAVGWLLAALIGWGCLHADDHLWYVGAVLLWFGPPLALQNAFGGDLLAAERGVRVRVLLPSLLFLWAADRWALHTGAWHISAPLTVAPWPAGIPVEELLFFALTSMLVANTALLTTHPAMRARWATPRDLARRARSSAGQATS